MALTLSAALTRADRPAYLAAVSQTVEQSRIRYDVAAFEEQGARRELLSETTVEGPAGTDFEIKLRGARFRLDARFLNDLVAPGALKVRAEIKTRRLYGQSERGLPLYEEDEQKQALQLGFDEKMVLLPFGSNDQSPNADQLRIEITPTPSGQSARLASGAKRPLEIKILKAGPGNSITVEASKSPHRFAVEAALFEDGREVARGSSEDFLVEEPREIRLAPNDRASAEVAADPLAVSLSVEQYLQRRPADEAAFSFDLYSLGGEQGGRREPFAPQWAGVGEIGSVMSYDISGRYLKSSGRRYELRLSVRLAPGEVAE
ncbi:MAG: hypothetical protein M3348_10580 [Acidobacteriota bacterium]|nr:hypothetical protein [Acidobacteriota bacterium]